MEKKKTKAELDKALAAVQANQHQDLAKEHLGYEPEEQQEGDPNSPFKLKETLDDKRPEDASIKKGWTVDSNTSRNPQDQKNQK